MDTTTVLEIIKMLDKQIKNLESLTGDWYKAEKSALTSFRDHLQEWVEAQLNALENQSTEQ